MEVENDITLPLEVQVEDGNNLEENVDVITTQNSSETIPDQSSLINSASSSDKEEDEDSTLMNKQESRQSEVQCDEEDDIFSN
jgi:hypothetical protein